MGVDCIQLENEGDCETCGDGTGMEVGCVSDWLRRCVAVCGFVGSLGDFVAPADGEDDSTRLRCVFSRSPRSGCIMIPASPMIFARACGTSVFEGKRGELGDGDGMAKLLRKFGAAVWAGTVMVGIFLFTDGRAAKLGCGGGGETIDPESEGEEASDLTAVRSTPFAARCSSVSKTDMTEEAYIGWPSNASRSRFSLTRK